MAETRPTAHKKPYRLLIQTHQESGPETPAWILTSPHSGHLYPEEFIKNSLLSAHDLRRSEDAHIDRLLEQAPQYGAAVLAAIYPRAYLDLNREAYELDPDMFSDALPDHVISNSVRVKAGLGTIARIVADRMPIYPERMSFAEADQRIQEIHVPFHNKLQDLLVQAVTKYGQAYLLDIHSMPSSALAHIRAQRDRLPEIILGDRHGRSCASELTQQVEAYLTEHGYRVGRNTPYAGGYITQSYGLQTRMPDLQNNVHALQIEISRALYMDEKTYLCHEGFARLQDTLMGLLTHLQKAIASQKAELTLASRN